MLSVSEEAANTVTAGLRQRRRRQQQHQARQGGDETPDKGGKYGQAHSPGLAFVAAFITAGNNVSESRVHAKRDLTPAALPTVAVARAAMLAGTAKLDNEFVALGEAMGRVLAAPILASRDQPPFAISEMDGYAVMAADTPGKLKLIGESVAGRGFAGEWQKGGTVRISTGAAIPAVPMRL